VDQPANLFSSVATIQRLLEGAGIQSMVVGGLAVLVWGKARLTQDADLKVGLGRDESRRLLTCLAPHYQFLSAQPEDTLARLGFVFVRDPSGVRIDLLLADTGFDAEAMRRRRDTQVMPGLGLYVCSPEDLVVYKMISTRARDQEDVAGIVRRQKTTLDHDYVEAWLRQFEQALDDSTLLPLYQRLRQANT
jgi:hypothetical protein